DDDDGVTMPAELLRGADETITVQVGGVGNGFLNAWIDWNGDGDWDDADEQIVTDESIATGTHTLTVSVPLSATSGETGARFRLSESGGLGPIDRASFPVTVGEVEDYVVSISASAVSVEDDGVLPQAFALHGNYPNPFNPTTTLHFDLPEASPVRIQVFNLLGQVVRTVVDEQRPAGRHTVRFDATNLPSGTYLYRMDAGSFSQVRQMVLLK
ncbi:MAG: T9SS type A sorting domain-containing protein, partial [Bacteroidota bacterium]